MRGTPKTVVAASASASAVIAAVTDYRLYQATMNNTLNRFLFRPLIAGGGTITFAVPEHSDHVSQNSDFTAIGQGDQPLVQYSRSALKKEKKNAGFAFLHLEKEQVHLQDPAGPTIVVPCTTIGDSLFSTEKHTESRDGRLSTTATLTTWTTESSYLLRIQKPTKKEPEIALIFSSKLRRAEIRAKIESNCDIPDLPKDVVVFVPTSAKKQWSDLFHAKIPHMGDRKTLPFPSCEDINSIQMSKAPSGEAFLVVLVNKKGKKAPWIDGVPRNSLKGIRIRARDEESALRVGSKLAADCSVPFK